MRAPFDRHRGPIALTLLCALLLTTACSRSRVVESGAGQPLDDSATPGAPGVADGAVAGTPGTSDPAGAPGAPTASGSGSEGGGGPASGPASAGPADGSPVRVGIGWLNIDALLAAFTDPSRLGGVAGGTSRDAAAAVVEWVNAQGGINGHPIEPVYYEYPIAELVAPGGPQRAEQGMCEHFKDNGVTLAVPLVSAVGVFNSCAHEAGMISIASGNADEVIDAERFAQIGAQHYHPNWLVGERREQLLVPEFQRIGFFTPSARVGLMVADSPASRRIAAAALVPALQAIGSNVVKTVYYDPLATDYSSYVLQMQTSNATHIFYGGCACGGSQGSLFMSAAENQGYRPAYGLASDIYLGALVSTGAPKAQLERVVGLGWAPFQDTALSDYDAAAPVNAADATCRQIWTDSGLARTQALTVIALYCEAVFFLQHAFAGSPNLEPATLRAVVESQGFEFESPTTGITRFGPDHHDGVTTVRGISYATGCDCFRYHGPTLTLGAP